MQNLAITQKGESGQMSKTDLSLDFFGERPSLQPAE